MNDKQTKFRVDYTDAGIYMVYRDADEPNETKVADFFGDDAQLNANRLLALLRVEAAMGRV